MSGSDLFRFSEYYMKRFFREYSLQIGVVSAAMFTGIRVIPPSSPAGVALNGAIIGVGTGLVWNYIDSGTTNRSLQRVLKQVAVGAGTSLAMTQLMERTTLLPIIPTDY